MSTYGVPSPNLIPAPRLAKYRRTRRLRTWVATLVIYGGAAATIWTYFATSGHRLASVHADVESVASQVIAAQADLRSAQARLDLAQREVAARHEVQSHPDFSVLLRRMASAAGTEIAFDKVELKPINKDTGKEPKPDLAARWGYTLQITGIASSQAEVPRFAVSLESLGLFEAVSVQSIKAREAPIIELDDGTRVPTPQLFSFDLLATLSDEGVLSQVPGPAPSSGGAR